MTLSLSIKLISLAALVICASVLAFSLPRLDSDPQITSAQSSQVAYEIEVLPSRAVLSDTHENLSQTSGWHRDTGSGLQYPDDPDNPAPSASMPSTLRA